MAAASASRVVSEVARGCQAVHYDLLVGADGAGSIVRRALQRTLPHSFCTRHKAPPRLRSCKRLAAQCAVLCPGAPALAAALAAVAVAAGVLAAKSCAVATQHMDQCTMTTCACCQAVLAGSTPSCPPPAGCPWCELTGCAAGAAQSHVQLRSSPPGCG